MKLPSPMKAASLLARTLLVLSPTSLFAPLHAQTAHHSAHTSASQTTLPALFLSDIHLDPFLDPTKAAALDSAPISEWSRILSGASGPALTRAQQISFAACNDGPDTSYALWQSTLTELKKAAAHSRFVVISGDLLAHRFDCKYKALVPAATQTSYLAFTQKTVEYILSTLRTALPEIPVYTAMGNNDSGCTDYALAPEHDTFLTALAPLVAQSARLAPTDRRAAEHDFAALGAYDVPLAALQHTRIVSIDDLYLSTKYMTCTGARSQDPAAAVIVWLKTQLDSARAHHDRVWVVGHIPPGIDLYASARKLLNVCGGAKPTMFLGSQDLARTLAAYPDVVRLALFGHTHNDELRLLMPRDEPPPARSVAAERTIPETDKPEPVSITGIPLKIVSSITPVHGNRPTFTLARVNAATATLVDYTVMMASNPAQSSITWSPEYTFSSTYYEPAFDASSLTALIGDFQGDPTDKWPGSQAYIRYYFPAEAPTAAANSAVISAAWQPYACTLNHDSAKSFAACACAK